MTFHAITSLISLHYEKDCITDIQVLFKRPILHSDCKIKMRGILTNEEALPIQTTNNDVYYERTFGLAITSLLSVPLLECKRLLMVCEERPLLENCALLQLARLPAGTRDPQIFVANWLVGERTVATQHLYGKLGYKTTAFPPKMIALLHSISDSISDTHFWVTSLLPHALLESLLEFPASSKVRTSNPSFSVSHGPLIQGLFSQFFPISI